MNIFEGIMHLENNVTQILYNLLEYKIFRKEFLNFLDIQEDINYSNFDI